jgi:CTP synthase
VPFIEAAGELKTKPTQHSVNELRRIGIHPTSSSAARTRSSRATSATRSRSSPTSTPRGDRSPDVPDVYLVPGVLQREGLDELVVRELGLDAPPPSSASGRT